MKYAKSIKKAKLLRLHHDLHHPHLERHKPLFALNENKNILIYVFVL